MDGDRIFLCPEQEIMFTLSRVYLKYVEDDLSSSAMVYVFESSMVVNIFLTNNDNLFQVFYDSLSYEISISSHTMGSLLSMPQNINRVTFKNFLIWTPSVV